MQEKRGGDNKRGARRRGGGATRRIEYNEYFAKQSLIDPTNYMSFKITIKRPIRLIIKYPMCLHFYLCYKAVGQPSRSPISIIMELKLLMRPISSPRWRGGGLTVLELERHVKGLLEIDLSARGPSESQAVLDHRRQLYTSGPRGPK